MLTEKVMAKLGSRDDTLYFICLDCGYRSPEFWYDSGQYQTSTCLCPTEMMWQLRGNWFWRI